MKTATKAETHKKTSTQKPNRRSTGASKGKKKATEKPVQEEITARERYKDVDKQLTKMFEARDEVASWDESRTDALGRAKELLVEHGHTGIYHVDHGGTKYKVEIKSKSKISIAKVPKKELDMAN